MIPSPNPSEENDCSQELAVSVFPILYSLHSGIWEAESSGSFEKRGSTESPAASLVRKGSSLDF